MNWLLLNIVLYPTSVWFQWMHCGLISKCWLNASFTFTRIDSYNQPVITFYPSALRAGGVLSSRSGRADWRAGGRAVGRAGGCQTCGTHISVTAWWIFSVRSSMELSRPVVVHCHAHLPICPIWACPNLQANVSATVSLFGGDSSHTLFLIDKVFKKTLCIP